MNERMLYEAELRDRAALATALRTVLERGLTGPGTAPDLKAEKRRLRRMREFLADSAYGAGQGHSLVGVEIELRPRPDVERRDIYELVRRLTASTPKRPLGTKQVVEWIQDASLALQDLERDGWSGLTPPQKGFLKAEFLPFLERLSSVDQDIDERRPRPLSTAA